MTNVQLSSVRRADGQPVLSSWVVTPALAAATLARAMAARGFGFLTIATDTSLVGAEGTRGGARLNRGTRGRPIAL